MPSDQLSPEGYHRYVKKQSEPPIAVLSSHSFRLREHPRIFDELPKADIVSVSRPDARDISPMLPSYTVEFRYKQFKWCLVKKASQVLYLYLTLKKHAFIEEFYEKQEQVKEWLQNLGLGEHMPVVQDDEEADDQAVTLAQVENLSAKSRSMCLLKIKNLLNHLWMDNHGKLENFLVVFASHCGWNTWVPVLDRSIRFRILSPMQHTGTSGWQLLRQTNTTIYHDVFSCVPNDLIHSQAKH